MTIELSYNFAVMYICSLLTFITISCTYVCVQKNYIQIISNMQKMKKRIESLENFINKMDSDSSNSESNEGMILLGDVDEDEDFEDEIIG